MKFIIGIKPQVMMGHGTMKDARARFRESMRVGAFCCSSRFGSAYCNDYGRRDTTEVYGYNIEVFKRGKHRKNKHYVVYKYTFPIEMFKLLNVEIIQGARTFKIVPKK